VAKQGLGQPQLLSSPRLHVARDGGVDRRRIYFGNALQMLKLRLPVEK